MGHARLFWCAANERTRAAFKFGLGQREHAGEVGLGQPQDRLQIERVHAALFEPWTYRDDRYSMRWDPLEDRRYALMDRDPTASDNKSRTVWMANLFAYRSLVLFPSALFQMYRLLQKLHRSCFEPNQEDRLLQSISMMRDV